MNLRELDLNLLVLLDTLLEERSVTNAADALGMSQPAMSHALARLRSTFDDRILVRSGRDMVPTARAVSLREKLRSVLKDVQDIVDPVQSFDPSSSEREFRMLTNGFAGYAFLPNLMNELAKYNATFDLRVSVHATGDLRARLGEGEADLALIVSEMSKLPESLKHRKLYHDPFVCLVRKDHPKLVDGALSLESYVKLDHILVSPKGDAVGVVDGALAQLGHKRRVSVVVPNFMAVPGMLRQSDCVVTVPRSTAHVVTPNPTIVRVAPPLDLPVGTLFALWHDRTHADEGHRWFRQRLADAAEAMESYEDDLSAL